MISQYTIKNFKAVGAAVTLEIRPITLLFGANSAGKSSLIHSLLMLNHLSKGGSPDALRTDAGGDFVHLGGHRQYAHLGRVEDETLWSFWWKGQLQVDGFETLGAPRLDEPYRATISVQRLPKREMLRERKWEGADPENLDRLTLAQTVEVADSRGAILRYRNGEIVLHPHPVTWQLAQEALKVLGKDAPLEPVFSGPNDLLLFLGALLSLDSLDPLRSTESDELLTIGVLSQPLEMMLYAHQTSRKLRDALRVVLRYVEGRTANPVEFSYICEGLVDPGNLDAYLPEGPDVYSDFLDYWKAEGYEDTIGSLKHDVELREAMWDAFSNHNHAFDPLRSDLLRFVHRVIREALSPARDMSYLGPLRATPGLEGLSSIDETPLDPAGDSDWRAIARDSELRSEINEWLKRLGSDLEVSVKRLFREDSLRSVLAALSPDVDVDPDELIASLAEESKTVVLRDRTRNHEVSIRNVGVGISQVLPVLARALAGGTTGTLHMIEQPELHLHPALQAELADLFVQGVRGDAWDRIFDSKEIEFPVRRTFLIETHSEHLILRLLRRIRETTEGRVPKDGLRLRPEDVAVYYAMPTEDGTKFLRMEVSDHGDFTTPWPHGFFPERLKELL